MGSHPPFFFRNRDGPLLFRVQPKPEGAGAREDGFAVQIISVRDSIKWTINIK